MRPKFSEVRNKNVLLPTTNSAITHAGSEEGRVYTKLNPTFKKVERLFPKDSPAEQTMRKRKLQQT